MLPDLELGTVFEEDNNADNETFGQETDEDKEDTKLLQKKRRRFRVSLWVLVLSSGGICFYSLATALLYFMEAKVP